MLSVAVPYFSEMHFVSLQKHSVKAQQMSLPREGRTGQADLVGRAAAVLKAKAEDDIFPELFLTVTTFSRGSPKGEKGTHCSRVCLWLHVTDSQVPDCPSL